MSTKADATAARFSVKRLVSALGIGILFGIGLAISGMTQPSKVFGFLDFFGDWDASLALVMGGAIAVHLTTRRLILRRSEPIFDSSFRVAGRLPIDGRLLAGAVLFGIGWGLGGVCPGPSITALSSGAWQMLLFVGAMCGGILLFQVTTKLWLGDGGGTT